MECRICHAQNAKSMGHIRAYLDYGVEIFDCAVCGCRFTQRDDSAYERLHCDESSTYGTHQQFAHAVKRHFDRRNLGQLEQVLSAAAKNRHIINEAKSLNAGAHAMEAGCSLGYLTSWFIAHDIDVIGIDVSQTAIDKATALFGPHFRLITDAAIEKCVPYDFIYHAGTIGCVDDPIGLTRYWLSLLKPGGRLVFNAPNKALADQLGKLWPYTTTPPDLVTLFPDTFWQTQFASIANVSTQTLPLNQRDAMLFRWLPTFVMRARPYLFKSSDAGRFMLRGINFVARHIAALLRDTSDSTLPAEFGVMVTLRKY